MTNTNEIEFSWMRAKVHFAVIFVCTGFVLTILAQNARFHELNRELVEIEKRRIDLDEERERLSIEIDRLSSPGRVRAWASQELGMVVPDATQIREFRPGN